MHVDVYTWQEVFVTTLSSSALLSFVHTDELNGEDSVAITTTYPLKAGYRLVWADRLGVAHEHICQDPQGLHSDGITLYTDTALNSICELFGDYIEDKRPYGYSFYKALEVALEPTRWSSGTVDQDGSVANLSLYHTSAREAINDILEYGGELETEIEVGTNPSTGEHGVSTRNVNIRAHRGETSTHKRFSYSKDINSISRTEHAGAITACYGYGKGTETDSGGYGRKLTFGDVNGGLDYLEDYDARDLYGRPDPNGKAHVFGIYENSECEDMYQLIDETQIYLDAHKTPSVTYEADVIDLLAFGRSWEGVGVGDDVQLVDTSFSPELRCEGRVSKLVTDMLAGTQTVTLGNVTESMADTWQSQQQAVSSLTKRSSNWDVAANSPVAYLQQLIDGLNEQFNTSGMSYCYTSFEQGTIWASVPLDDDGLPVNKSGSCSAIQICSQGFRIASGLKSDGTWNWRTFGTGAGFTADEITAGTLNANLIKAGVISDKAGKNSWDLTTGKLVTNDMVANSMTASDMKAYNMTALGVKATNMEASGVTATNMNVTGLTAVNMKASGAFKAANDAGTSAIEIDDGEIRGYSDGKLTGTIDPNAILTDLSTGTEYSGLRIAGNSLSIWVDKLSILNSSDTSKTGYIAPSGTLLGTLVTGFYASGNELIFKRKEIALETCNGIVTSLSTTGEATTRIPISGSGGGGGLPDGYTTEKWTILNTDGTETYKTMVVKAESE